MLPVPLPDPGRLLADAPAVRRRLADAGFTTTGLDDLLGPRHREHLDAGELAPLLRRTASGSPLEELARALVLGVPAPGALPPSWLRPDGTAAVRLQPVEHDGVEVLVPYDPDRRPTEAEQVLGVGAASLTLAAATPRDPVGRTLDLGGGSGVQALLAARHSAEVTVTDSNPRASAHARLAGLLNGVDLNVRTGDLLDPVRDQTYDLIVCNPPFVVGPQRRYTYRDSGLAGDALCARLVRELPAHLAPGGFAVLLLSWLHVAGEDGEARVRGWFQGADGWVVQRELAGPEDYVTAWVRDSDEGPGAYDAWLDWFASERVEAVAFGIAALRPGTGDVRLDALDQPLAPTWGAQVRQHFAARDLLARDLLAGDLLGARLRLREDVRLHQVARPGADGWEVEAQLLVQQAGLRLSGGVDAWGTQLLAGCDGTRRLGDLLAVLASGAGLSDGQLHAQVLPVVRELLAQGFLTG